ncbi:antirestriction protein (plasmid) [Xenorhabdus stockiae]|uniref:antirestriction protein n=1 Tax=Xenorhabdus stockiae TaxID=351614 RepID=UPI003CF457A0
MTDIVKKRILNAEQKSRFLPDIFDVFFPDAENYVNHFMHQYAKGYDGGEWEYVIMPNGAYAFIGPKGYHLSLSNYFDEFLSKEEVGIIVALYAFSHYCCIAFDKGWDRANELMAQRFHALRDYTETLPSDVQSRIFRAID